MRLLPLLLSVLLLPPDAAHAELRILFSAREAASGPYDFYSIRADGTDLMKHTATAAISEWGAALSPDGTRLAFVDPTVSTNNLRIMALSGGPAVTVAIAGKANAVQWLDNNSLVYLQQNGATTTQYRIYKVNADGTESAIYSTVWRCYFTGVDSFHYHRPSARLYFGASTSATSTGPVTPHSGTLAAAGPDIVFTRGTDVLVAGESGSQGTTLVDHYDPIVSPDGSKIAYCADHGTGYHKLYVRNNGAADTASQVRVCDQYCGDPEWAPDGTWLAFTRATASSFGSSAYVGNIHRVTPSGTGLSNLTVAHTSIAGRSAHPMIYESSAAEPPFILESSRNAAAGTVTLTWPVKPGSLYRLRYSDDFLTWRTDLPNSARTAGGLETSMTYVDQPTAVPRRFYQVTRE